MEIMIIKRNCNFLNSVDRYQRYQSILVYCCSVVNKGSSPNFVSTVNRIQVNQLTFISPEIIGFLMVSEEKEFN